jgi:hypothetical protein
MAGFSFDFSCLAKMSRDIQKIGTNVKKNEAAVVKLAANEYKNDVQAIIQYKTGTLRRSVHVEMTSEGLKQVALIGTDAPYAKRLEHGFMDKDSLGRVYHQSPAPRWRPAWDTNLPKYERIIKGAFNRAQWEADIETSQSVRPDLLGGI